MRFRIGIKLPRYMAHLRRLLAYSVCVAIATPPFAYGQTTAPRGANAQPNQSGMAGVNLSASQAQSYARLMIKWPVGTTFEANGALNNGLMLIRLPRPLDVDPSIFSRSAPLFVAGAALSGDKRTIRVALVQPARLVASRSGDTQVFDLVQPDAPNPPALGDAPATPAPQAQTAARAPGEPLAKMINGAAPANAPRI